MANEALQIGKNGITDFNNIIIPPELLSSFQTLLTIIKAIGIIFIVYFIFLIISTILDIRKNLMIKKMYEKINEINLKLNKILKK